MTDGFDLTPTDDQVMIRDVARRFATEVLRPAAAARATGAPRTTSPADSAERPSRRERENAMPDHTVRSYDDELSDLAQKIAEMGGLAEQQVAEFGDRAVDP